MARRGYPPEFRRRAVELVEGGRKISEVDTGRRGGLTTEEQARIKELERENRELRRTNDILRKASAYFAQAELDRRPK